MRRVITILAVLGGLLTVAPAASAVTETASTGDVTARLTYTKAKFNQAKDVRLTVVRAGVTVLDRAAVAKGCDFCEGAMPIGGLGGDEVNSLTVRAIDGGAEPTVIVDLFTGGAHCCTVSALYRYDAATSRYQRLLRFWGNSGYTLKDIDGRGPVEFLTDDDSFAYRFCAYVCSVRPLRILRLGRAGFTDSSKAFPARLEADAASIYKLYVSVRKHKSDRFAVKGVIPAYCADVIRLGQMAKCTALLDKALRRGELNDRGFGPTGEAYIRDVRGFLVRSGYTKSWPGR